MLLPLSEAQAHIWSAQQLDPGGTFYNLAKYVEILGDADANLLISALRITICETDMLHTSFVQIAYGARQYTRQCTEIALPIIDVSEDADPLGAALAWMRRDKDSAFDLSSGPLFRFALLRLGEARFIIYALTHHLINDGFGSFLLQRRVAEVYSSLAANIAPPARTRPSISDLLQDDEAYRQSDRFARDRTFWREQLVGRPGAVTLSGRPPALAGRVVTCDARLPGSIADKLQALAARHDASLAAAIMCLAALYISKMTGEREVILGVPVSARTSPVLRRTVGFVANIVPLRLDIDPAGSVGDLLRQAGAHLRAARRHQRYWASAIRQDLGLAANQPDVYGTLVNFIPADDELTFAGQPVRAGLLGNWRVDDLLIVVAAESCRRELHLSMIGHDARYDEQSLKGHAERFMRLIALAAGAADLPIARFDILPPAERDLVVHGWNAAALSVAPASCIHEMFEAQAVQTPASPALIFENTMLSYASLNAAANRLAHHLLALGVAADRRVAIALARGSDMIVAMLATLKAGGAYVPLDPAYPAAHLATMIEDSAPCVLLSHSEVLHALPPLPDSCAICLIDTGAPAWADQPVTNPPPGPHAASLAYVIYTSGSTGIPKGVMVEHRNLVHATRARLDVYHLPTARFLLLSSFAFDSSLAGIFGTLSQGGALVLPMDAALPDARALAGLMAAHAVSHLLCVPSLYAALLDWLPQEALDCLTTVIVAGETCPPALVARHMAACPQTNMYNEYGPTECSVWSSVHQCRRDEAGPVPIGRPIPGTRIYVLDAHGAPAPVGVAGDLYIGGAGVARGYLNRPDLTAACFLPDRFAAEAGLADARMYKTGDRGRWEPDGTLVFLGRIDGQAKINGYRIELGEIEAHLLSHAGVHEAVVVTRPTAQGEIRLAAYFTAAEDIPSASLRAHLALKLPGHMMPGQFRRIAAIPTTPSGKRDRNALPMADAEAPAQRSHEAPRGPVEKAIAAIWSDLLKVERIDRHDNFFECGGHSLLAISLIERLRRQGWQANAESIFSSPTVAGQAALIQQARAAIEVPPNRIGDRCDRITPDMLPLASLAQPEIDAIVATVPGGIGNIQDIYPLAPLQEGILVHHLMSHERDAYVLRLLLTLETRGHVGRFLAALQSVIDRHDALRTAIRWQGMREPLQIVLRIVALPREAVACEGDDPAEAVWNMPYVPLDIGEAPLIRASVAESATGKCGLLLRLHHLAVDHTTLGMILDELHAFLAGEADRLPTPLPFRAFLAELRLATDVPDHAAFFTKMLGDVRHSTAPFGLLDTRNDGSGVTEAQLGLDPALARRLRALAKAKGVTAASLFHLAWALVLARTSGYGDVVFGTVLFGRMHGGAAAGQAVGLYVNTLPLRVTLDARPVAQALLDTHGDLLDLLLHEHASLSLAQRCSGVPADQPLFTALLNYRYSQEGSDHATRPSLLVPGMRLLRVEERSSYPITLTVDDFGDDFGLIAQTVAPADPARLCLLMQSALEQLVRALEEASDTPVASLDIVPFAERDLVVQGWNTVPLAPPSGARDRNASPAREGQISGVNGSLRTTSLTPTEHMLAAMWRDVLEVPGIDASDDFFMLGGHSLSAVRILVRVNEFFNLNLPLRVLFETRTLARMAGQIDLALRGAQSSPAKQPAKPRIGVAMPGETAPLSLSQERMWTIQALDPTNTAYNIAAALHISGELNVEALSAAIEKIRDRHEVLRATVSLVDGVPQQTFHRSIAHSALTITRLAGSVPLTLSAALELAESDARTPFDLAAGPVFRVSLLRMDACEHLLSVVLHHFAGDQWSLGILSREFAALYNGIVGGAAEDLTTPGISYRDYAIWQRNAHRQTAYAEQLEYWREKLVDLPVLELPTDRPRPRIPRLVGELLTIPIPAILLAAINDFSCDNASTLFITMFSAFAALLHRASGQTIIPIGVPVANRTEQATEALVGTLVNTLVLVTDFSGKPTFHDLLGQVRNTALDAFANQDVSFDMLVQEFAQRRDKQSPPLAQVLFNVVNAPMAEIALEGLICEPIVLGRGGAQFELGVAIDPQITHCMHVEYNTDLFDRSTIERLFAGYLRLVEAAISAPQTGVCDLPFVSPEQLVLLSDWNKSSAPYPDNKVFCRLFEDQVTRCPDVAAACFEGVTLTYVELNARANALAHRLQGFGAAPGVLVAVCVERSLLLLVALLGIMKSGAAYVPLDPGFSADRLKLMLSDSKAKFMLADSSLADDIDLPHGMIRVQCSLLASLDDSFATANLAAGPNPEDAAYVIYTSGSTGRPKAVNVHHRALTNLLWSMRLRPGLTATDVLAAVTTISFDIAALELFLPLLVGASVEIVSRATARDGPKLAQLLVARNISVLQATPSTWRMLVEANWPGGSGFRALCGGEPLPRELADKILQRVGELWNLYGPTETTIWSTIERVEPGDAAISIGRPIGNTTIHILDGLGEIAPIGQPGEIYIGGAGVACGYLGRPQLTAERFVPDRFSKVPNTRLYRTGDLGRWNAEGRLFHLGRLDHQVKLRGYRIELGEIEACICDVGAVRQAVVTVRDRVNGDPSLVAYIVYRLGEDITSSDMRRHMQSQLPDYMIPPVIIALPSLPLTQNGKTDFAALPDPFGKTVPAITDGDAPASGMELIMADIWRSVLPGSIVTADDNFFDLGGHSLLSLRVAQAIERRTGYRFDPRALFFNNLRQVSAIIEAGAPAADQKHT